MSMADFVIQNEVQNRVHSKKLLLHSLSTSVEVPVTAMHGRVNEASGWNVVGLVKVQKEMSQLLGIKKTAGSIITGWLKTCYS